MKKFFYIITLLSISTLSYAIQLDSMLKVSDEFGNGSFIVTNDKDIPYFIEASINEITTKNGNIVKRELNRDNLDTWGIVLGSQRMILKPQRSKNVTIRALCGNNCDYDIDKVYEITFIPKIYSPEGEEYGSSLNVFVGYAPVFIIPSQEQKIDYIIENKDDKLRIFNSGNSFIKVMIDGCSGTREQSCLANYTVLSGRDRSYNIPEKLRNKSLNIIVVNHDESYRKNLTLKQK